ncbi:MAG: DNA-deoxyinosine glycosylase [Methanoregula sp.]|nr:DNA-deoxyinosine glycosylase [Methanoregula sp.]
MDTASAPPAPERTPGLPPVTGTSPEVLVLGSFPSRQSLLRCEYYGNSRNHFWQIVNVLFLIDRDLPYATRIARLAAHHIALWDVIHSCRREGSADDRIRDPVKNDIAGFLATHPSVRLIALNGTAAKKFYFAPKNLPESRIAAILLPSTSPANTRLSLAKKIQRWEIIRTGTAKKV